MFRERLLILSSLIKANLLAAALGGFGILLVLAGFITTLVSSDKEKAIIFDNINEASSSARLYVDVGGAVVSPGVYELKPDARVHDALIAAGGLSNEANRDWVSKNLNLARKVGDGTKIYIPKTGESVSLPAGKAGQNTQGVSSSDSQTIGLSEGLINVNTASLVELDRLPGIGPVTGQKIIDNRPYSEVSELLNKKVVGKKVFEQVKGKITAY